VQIIHHIHHVTIANNQNYQSSQRASHRLLLVLVIANVKELNSIIAIILSEGEASSSPVRFFLTKDKLGRESVNCRQNYKLISAPRRLLFWFGDDPEGLRWCGRPTAPIRPRGRKRKGRGTTSG
jgi:hypothetical protein